MAGKKQKSYDDFELCKDVAQSELTRSEIAQKYGISEGMVGQIARGDSRPELRPIISELIDSSISEAVRIFRSRGRWFATRLVRFAEDDNHPEVALRAVFKGLELAGLTKQLAQQSESKKTIHIILSGEDGKDPPKRNLKGVYRPN